MQYINHWPDVAKLSLLETVAHNLLHQLLQPFADEIEAKQFWQETSSILVILDHSDSINDLKESDAWSQIEFALTYPEYTVPLAIVNIP